MLLRTSDFGLRTFRHLCSSMDYQLQFRKFISSQYLYTGIRITMGVIIPAFLLYRYGLLVDLIALPLGALFISLTDNPGPIEHRRNGMLVATLLSFVVLVVAGYSRGYPVLIIIELIVFGFIFTLIGVFGNRSNSIGLIALLIFILNVDLPRVQNVLEQAAYFVGGGLWYTFLSLVLYTLRPYRVIQQLLGEYIMEIADYLQTRKLFYEKDRNLSSIYKQLMQHQVKIHLHQEELRHTLYTTRKYLSESTAKGRVLMMMFLDSIDLVERIMTSQQDYELLHKQFGETGILEKYKEHIDLLSRELRNIGLALQSTFPYKSDVNIEEKLEEITSAFFELRDQQLSSENFEGFIRLRHILYSLQDITERIKRLETYTTFDKKLSKQYRQTVDLDKFISPERINLQLLASNISLKSSIFRHAVRLVIALVVGYIVSLLFPLGHGYWILLTIGVILKPAYSITRQRNVQRLIGTFIGVAIGFAILYLTNQSGPLFIAMMISMIVAYSFLKLNYTVSSVGITIFVLLNFHFLSGGSIQHLLIDRVIDTVIGSAIAYLVSHFVLPAWEHQKIDEYVQEALKANRKYFMEVTRAYLGEPADITSFKISRKEAFVALANLSDNFQKMLSEPKSQQRSMEDYHQFVAASHMLTSYIASLSYYVQRNTLNARPDDFRELVQHGDRLFETAIHLMEKGEMPIAQPARVPMNEKVEKLVEQRKMELASGIINNEQSVRKKLSELKTVVEQFHLIYANLGEQIKIISKIKDIKLPALQTAEQN